MDWHPIGREPLSHEKSAFSMWYIPPGNYVLGAPSDKEAILSAYPEATHYKILTLAPQLPIGD